MRGSSPPFTDYTSETSDRLSPLTSDASCTSRSSRCSHTRPRGQHHNHGGCLDRFLWHLSASSVYSSILTGYGWRYLHRVLPLISSASRFGRVLPHSRLLAYVISVGGVSRDPSRCLKPNFPEEGSSCRIWRTHVKSLWCSQAVDCFQAGFRMWGPALFERAHPGLGTFPDFRENASPCARPNGGR